MQTTPSGLQYDDTVTGTGKLAEAGRTVSVHYTGWLYDDGVKGKKFDSSKDRDDPFEFRSRRQGHGDRRLGRRRRQGMKVGGTRKLDDSARNSATARAVRAA